MDLQLQCKSFRKYGFFKENRDFFKIFFGLCIKFCLNFCIFQLEELIEILLFEDFIVWLVSFVLFCLFICVCGKLGGSYYFINYSVFVERMESIYYND